MADVTPNWRLQQQVLKSQIAAQQANIERQRLEIMEMIDRKDRNVVNIEASEKAIAELTEQLDGLEQTHGPLSDSEFKAFVGTLTER